MLSYLEVIPNLLKTYSMFADAVNQEAPALSCVAMTEPARESITVVAKGLTPDSISTVFMIRTVAYATNVG